MKVRKVTVSVFCETLSIDSVPALLAEVITQIQNEHHSGKLVASDGDCIRWETDYSEPTTV